MARSRDKLAAELAAIEALRGDPAAPEARARLLAAVASKKALVVAAAARVAGQGELDEVLDALPAAFERFMLQPVKSDPGCRAKLAIADTLYRLDRDADEVFLAGVRHIQMEPIWGGQQDTGADLRIASLMGLVRMSHPRSMIEAAHLLADAERPARIAAARALAYSTNADVGVPLLRLKLMATDDEPVVVSACLAALLELAGDDNLDFVSGYLDDDEPAIVEAAAMALGESRLDGALAPLRAMADDSVTAPRRKVAMLAIAMLRTDDAWAHLLEVIAREPAGAARDAVSALSIYRYDEALCARIEQAADGRNDVDLAELLGPADD